MMLLSWPGAAWSQDLLGSQVNGVMGLDFLTTTSRREDCVEDEGLVTQPLLILPWSCASNQGKIRM